MTVAPLAPEVDNAAKLILADPGGPPPPPIGNRKLLLLLLLKGGGWEGANPL